MADDEEDRIVRIGAENRTLLVEPDDTHTGSLYPRTLTIPYEDRTYEVDFVQG